MFSYSVLRNSIVSVFLTLGSGGPTCESVEFPLACSTVGLPRFLPAYRWPGL